MRDGKDPQPEGWEEEEDEYNDDDDDDEAGTGTGLLRPPGHAEGDGPKPVVMDHDDDDDDGTDGDEKGVPSAAEQQSPSGPSSAPRDDVRPPDHSSPTNGPHAGLAEATAGTAAAASAAATTATPAETRPGPSDDAMRQFSEQLVRLEEHHRAELAEMRAELERGAAAAQHAVQERDRLLHQHRTERDRQADGAARQLEAAQRDLAKARELLVDREREGRRLQEAHLKQLRDMEKQMNSREDTSHGLEKSLQDLEVRARPFGAFLLPRTFLPCPTLFSPLPPSPSLAECPGGIQKGAASVSG